MLSNSQKKYIKSLHQKKYRQKYNKFIVETPKIVGELINSQSYTIESICANAEWIERHKHLLRSINAEVYSLGDKDLRSISNLKNPNQVLAVVEQHVPTEDISKAKHQWALYLDDIKDPGNLGTIIRNADWFGVNTIIKSPDSVDFYNAKVIQASMGSFFRLDFSVSPFNDLLDIFETRYALSLNGDNIFETPTKPGLLVIGSESHGVSQDIINSCTGVLTIPGSGRAESLNAAVASGIALSILI